MGRTIFSVIVVGIVAGSACAQGFHSPAPVAPAPFAPQWMAPVVAWRAGMGSNLGWSSPGITGGFALGRSYYGLPYYGYYSTPTTSSNTRPVEVPALQGAGGNGSAALLPELPAELTIEFPASATVTLDGVPVPGTGALQQWKSPPLKVGQRHTFTVTARWTLDGRKFEWDRAVALGAGERGRVAVARGFPVPD